MSRIENLEVQQAPVVVARRELVRGGDFALRLCRGIVEAHSTVLPQVLVHSATHPEEATRAHKTLVMMPDLYSEELDGLHVISKKLSMYEGDTDKVTVFAGEVSLFRLTAMAGLAIERCNEVLAHLPNPLELETLLSDDEVEELLG